MAQPEPPRGIIDPDSLLKAVKAELDAEWPALLRRALKRASSARAIAAPSLTVAPPRKRPANPLPRGAATNAVLAVIKAYVEDGIKSADIRIHATTWLKGRPISPHTLKRVLFTLKKDDRIENRNGRWYPARSAYAPGTIADTPRRTVRYDTTGRRQIEDE